MLQIVASLTDDIIYAYNIEIYRPQIVVVCWEFMFGFGFELVMQRERR